MVSRKKLDCEKVSEVGAGNLFCPWPMLKDERSNKGAAGPIILQVNLGNMSVDVPEVEAEWEILDDGSDDA